METETTENNEINELLKELIDVIVKREVPVTINTALSATGTLFQNIMKEHNVTPEVFAFWCEHVQKVLAEPKEEVANQPSPDKE